MDFPMMLELCADGEFVALPLYFMFADKKILFCRVGMTSLCSEIN